MKESTISFTNEETKRGLSMNIAWLYHLRLNIIRTCFKILALYGKLLSTKY